MGTTERRHELALPLSAQDVPPPERAAGSDDGAQASLIGQLSSEDLADRLTASRLSVTAFLERLAEEPIDADVRSQLLDHRTAPSSLELAHSSAVLRRSVVLRGRASGRSFVYARTAIAAHRLPETVRWQLEHTEHTIGRILETNGISTQRAAVGVPHRPWSFADYPEGGLHDAVLARRYVISIDHEPVFDVCEWFLATITGAPEGA